MKLDFAVLTLAKNVLPWFVLTTIIRMYPSQQVATGLKQELIVAHALMDIGDEPPNHSGPPVLRFGTKGVQADIVIEALTADLIYNVDRPWGGSLIEISNEVNHGTHGDLIKIDAHDYISILDNLYPNRVHGGVDSVACGLFSAAYVIIKDFLQAYTGVILLPIVQQQQFYPKSRIPRLNVSCATQSYKITVAHRSMQIYIVFTGIILLWCLARLTPSIWIRTPEMTGIAELDIIEKIDVNQGETLKVISQISDEIWSSSPKEWRARSIEAMHGVKILVNQRNDRGKQAAIELLEGNNSGDALELTEALELTDHS